MSTEAEREAAKKARLTDAINRMKRIALAEEEVIDVPAILILQAAAYLIARAAGKTAWEDMIEAEKITWQLVQNADVAFLTQPGQKVGEA